MNHGRQYGFHKHRSTGVLLTYAFDIKSAAISEVFDRVQHNAGINKVPLSDFTQNSAIFLHHIKDLLSSASSSPKLILAAEAALSRVVLANYISKYISAISK